MTEHRKSLPELLAPAGDLESLRAAVDFGADAVYVGAQRFGMRSSPKNFDFQTLTRGVEYAHGRGARVYLTCNILMRNADIPLLPEFFRQVRSCGVDALIVTDLGALEIARETVPELEIHISTQEGITNYRAAASLVRMGARRVVLARELPLDEIARITRELQPEAEVECFVHGSMCVSFSGRCLLSEYFTGRDANRGDCAQPCRWKYALMESTREGEYLPIDETSDGTFILSSRDLCMIEHIPELVRAGIASLKIEGRAKAAYYTAVVTNAYRCALDAYAAHPTDAFQTPEWIVQELEKVSHRTYCTGYYFDRPGSCGQIHPYPGYLRGWQVAAIVEECRGGRCFVTQRNRFFEGEELEVLPHGREPLRVTVHNLRDVHGSAIANAPHPMMAASFDCARNIEPGAILRRRNQENLRNGVAD